MFALRSVTHFYMPVTTESQTHLFLLNDALCLFSIRTAVATKQTDTNKALFNEIGNEQESRFLSTRFIL